jgi:hypothetical protein
MAARPRRGTGHGTAKAPRSAAGQAGSTSCGVALDTMDSRLRPVNRLRFAITVTVARYRHRRSSRTLIRRRTEAFALVGLAPEWASDPAMKDRKSKSIGAVIQRALAAHVPAWPWRADFDLEETDGGGLVVVMRVRRKIIAVFPVPPGSALKQPSGQ